MRIFFSALALVCATAFMSQTASAQFVQNIYVVHGINGEDLGLDRDLKVDIAVDGVCAVPGVVFGDVLGPVELPDPGPYDVEISLSDGNCTGALAVTGQFDLSIGETATVVAHLDANSAPRITKFANNVSPVGKNHSRVTAFHFASAPKVYLRVKNNKTGKSVSDSLRNGQQTFPAEVRKGSYNIKIFPKGSRKAVFKTNAHLDGGTAYFAYAVGSTTNGVTVLFQAIEP